MTAYRVTWEIDVEADSPNEAAIAARLFQGPDTTALVFDVVEAGETAVVRVDLSEQRITHLAVRALHLNEPDDWTEEWDVVAKLVDGSTYYSEDTFCTESEAQEFLNACSGGGYPVPYWIDKPVLASLVAGLNWVEFKGPSW